MVAERLAQGHLARLAAVDAELAALDEAQRELSELLKRELGNL